MTSYTGYSNPSTEYVWDLLNIPFYQNVGYGRNYGRFYGTLVIAPNDSNIWETDETQQNGSHINNFPVSYTPIQHTGYALPTLVDIFYNRVLVEPVNIDFGNMIATKQENVLAWNGYLTDSITLDDLIEVGFDGVSVIGDSPPSVFLPLQERTYTIQATMDGPPTIEAELTFDWETGHTDYTVIIIGNRIVLYPYLYQSNMIETLSWSTKILTANNGSETRSSVRSIPRQRFSAKSYIQPTELARADNLMYEGVKNRIWAIPVWSEGRLITSAVTALDMTINVDTRYGDFRAGSLGVIWLDERNFDMFVILSFTDSVITIDSLVGIANNYPLGSVVAPIREGRMSSNGQRLSTGYNSVLSVGFNVDDNILLTVGASPVTYLGEDTYLDEVLKPRGNTFKDKYIRDVRVIDYDTGVVEQFAPWIYSKLRREFMVVLEGLEEIWDFREWLHRRGGKQRPFYMPSHERNMKVTGSGNIGLTFTIREDGNRTWGIDRDHIYIKMKDGTEYLRAVLDITDAGGGISNVTINSSITEEKTDIDVVSYMGLKRLDSDRIQIKWLANNVAQCVVPIMEILP